MGARSPAGSARPPALRQVTWSEGKVGRILARNTFAKALCVLPNSTWTGDEIDLLVVPPCLRCVDVEIKVSRADLRADRNKARWWRQPGQSRGGGPPAPIAYPKHVWKHYYAMPVDIWHADLLDIIWPQSGVLLVSESRGAHGLNGYAYGDVECVQRATPNKAAKPLGPHQIHAVARLASLRMWDTYRDLERVRDDCERRVAMYSQTGGGRP